jgi:hypothetical protein
MAISFRMSNRIDADVDTVLQLMTTPSEQEAISAEYGATTSRCTRTDVSERRVKIDMYEEEPNRKQGGVLRSTIHMDFDLDARTCTWNREDHEYGKLVRTEGKMTLRPAGEGACTMDESGEIDIKIPILGKKMARKIASALERKHPSKCQWWTRRAR